MDGSMVAKVYYEEQNLERIVAYCPERHICCRLPADEI